MGLTAEERAKGLTILIVEHYKNPKYPMTEDDIEKNISAQIAEAVSAAFDEKYPGATKASHSHAMVMFRDHTFPELAKLWRAEGFAEAREQAAKVAEKKYSSSVPQEAVGNLIAERIRSLKPGEK